MQPLNGCVVLTPLWAPAVGSSHRSQNFGSCYYVSPLLIVVSKHLEVVRTWVVQMTLDGHYLLLILICKLHIFLWPGWWFCLSVVPEFWFTLLYVLCLWLLYRLLLVTSHTYSIVMSPILGVYLYKCTTMLYSISISKKYLLVWVSSKQLHQHEWYCKYIFKHTIHFLHFY